MNTEQERGLYARICKDSGFSLPFDQAASLWGGIVGKHPLELWAEGMTTKTMMALADGSHPYYRRPEIAE